MNTKMTAMCTTTVSDTDTEDTAIVITAMHNDKFRSNTGDTYN